MVVSRDLNLSSMVSRSMSGSFARCAKGLGERIRKNDEEDFDLKYIKEVSLVPLILKGGVICKKRKKKNFIFFFVLSML